MKKVSNSSITSQIDQKQKDLRKAYIEKDENKIKSCKNILIILIVELNNLLLLKSQLNVTCTNGQKNILALFQKLLYKSSE